MHELSIAYSLVELAKEAAENSEIKKVKAIYLKLGVLSGVVKESLEFSFDVVVQGTSLEGSKLIIEEVPVTVFCPNCQEERILPEPFPMRCPVCKTKTGQVLTGRELELYAMEGGEENERDDFESSNCGNSPERFEEK